MSYNRVSSPVMLRSRPFSFIGAVLLIPVFGLGLLILGIWRWRNKTTTLSVSPSGVIFSTGILSKSVTELSMGSIRSVKVNKSFIERMLGTGRIDIFSAGDQAEIGVSGMLDPSSIRMGINSLREKDTPTA